MRVISLLILLLGSYLGYSQVDSHTDTSYLSQVTISDSRIELPFNDVSRSIELITKEEIQALNPASINALLQTVAGLDVRQRGINGVQADLSIRGGTFEQALLMINGVKMIDPQTGHHMMNLPITVEDIERIEVLKGPGARRYGQNAFAGAINIVTKTGPSKDLTFGINVGTYHTTNVFASSDLPIGDYQQKVSFSKDLSDGYRHNTDYDITNLFYQGRAVAGNTDFNIIAGHTARNFGANSFYGSTNFVDQYEETRTTFFSLGADVQEGIFTLSPRINWRKNKDNWQFLRQNPEVFQNFHTSDIFTAELNASITHPLGILGIGGELNDVDLVSSNLSDHTRRQWGYHIENRFLLLDDKIDITPGIYILKISDYDTQIYPGVDIGVNLNNDWKLFANYGQTSRIPSYTDLYYEDRANVGNPNLEIESAKTYEAGIKYHTPSALITASYFSRDAANLIDWHREDDDTKWMPDNFGAATYNGLDLSINLQIGSVLDHLKVGYLYLDAQLGDNVFAQSRNALENLRHQLIIQPSLKLSDQLSANLTYRYNDRVSLDNYGLLDANVSYQIEEEATISLRVFNLLDKEYRETNLVPMPGRMVSIGCRVHLAE